MDFEYDDIAKMMDHALLVPTTTVHQLEVGCNLAKAYNVASVCIMPYYLARCSELLADSTVMPSTVIGFPLGGHATTTKVAEAQQAIADGCQETRHGGEYFPGTQWEMGLRKNGLGSGD